MCDKYFLSQSYISRDNAHMGSGTIWRRVAFHLTECCYWSITYVALLEQAIRQMMRRGVAVRVRVDILTLPNDKNLQS